MSLTIIYLALRFNERISRITVIGFCCLLLAEFLLVTEQKLIAFHHDDNMPVSRLRLRCVSHVVKSSYAKHREGKGRRAKSERGIKREREREQKCLMYAPMAISLNNLKINRHTFLHITRNSIAYRVKSVILH